MSNTYLHMIHNIVDIIIVWKIQPNPSKVTVILSFVYVFKPTSTKNLVITESSLFFMCSYF